MFAIKDISMIEETSIKVLKYQYKEVKITIIFEYKVLIIRLATLMSNGFSNTRFGFSFPSENAFIPPQIPCFDI